MNAVTSHLEGFDAGRLQGWVEGRLTGYTIGYGEGHTDGVRDGWLSAGADERQRFAIRPTVGPSHAELQRKRTSYPTPKPVQTSAECLATWGNR